MKVAFLVEKFPTLTETFILSQITGLLDLGHDVRIIAQYDPMEARIHQDVYKYDLISKTYYCMPHSRYRRISSAIRCMVTNFHRAPLKVLKSLNVIRYGRSALSLTLFHTLLPFLNESFDVIHAHFGPNGITAVNLKSIGVESKVLTTFHGDDVSRYIKRHGNRVYKRLFAYGDLFLPVSEYWKNRLISLGCDSKKIIVHRMGIDTKKFHFSERKVREGEPVRILSVGRFVEKKGYQYALKAVARTLEKHKNMEYIIVGDGPLRDEILSLAQKLGIKEHIVHLKTADQEELSSLYQKAHIFLLPSVTASNGDQEGIPLVLMEAQATGLPVISTNHSGIPEVVIDGQSGFLLPERDEFALAKKIEYLIQHSECWPALGTRGRQIIERNHDVVELNRALERIFKRVVDGQNSASRVSSLGRS
jgi:colanic acid/amylovoran biosynthesis glycosyltransferase